MELHDLRLARGTYYCGLATGTGNHLNERTEFDIILDVLHFEILAPLTADGTLSEWYPEWGAIRFIEPKITRIA
jgi:lipopolysaccharide transport system ATP-binding protein